MALAAFIWTLPVVLPDDGVVRERVHTRHGTVKVTTVTVRQGQGWNALHSEVVAIGLLGLGVAVFALGALPPGIVASIKTPLGEVTFTEAEVAEVAGRAAKAVPDDQVTHVVSETLKEMGARRLTGVETSQSEIDATIGKIIEEEEAEGDETPDA